jgi:hypothetical protein
MQHLPGATQAAPIVPEAAGVGDLCACRRGMVDSRGQRPGAPLRQWQHREMVHFAWASLTLQFGGVWS